MKIDTKQFILLVVVFLAFFACKDDVKERERSKSTINSKTSRDAKEQQPPKEPVLAEVMSPETTPSKGDSQVHFNDLIGVNKAVPAMKNAHDLLLGGVIRHNRAAIRWDNHQKTDPDLVDENPNGADSEDWGAVWSRSTDIGELRDQYGVESVVGFGFTPAWATRTTNLKWTWEGVIYERTKDPDGNSMTLTYTRVGENNPYYTRKLSINDIQLPADDAHLEDWQEWVRQVVNVVGVTKGQPGIKPYAKVEHFQIWNEGHSGGPFYHGSMEEYFKRIHLPAVEMIRQNSPGRKKFGIVNKKIVFGGWIGPRRLRGGSPDLPDLLNDFSDKLDVNLWKTIDVLDVHYRSVWDMEQIRQEAVAAGYGDIGIWQTEWAAMPIDDTSPYERDPGSIANFYSRFAYWALRHNPENNPDKYRIYYFTYWSQDGTFSNGSYVTLVKGAQNGQTELTIYGKALQTMGQVLGPGAIDDYAAISSDMGLTFELNKQQEGIEAFKIQGEDSDRIVVAVHLNDKSGGTIEILLPKLKLNQVEFAERVTPWDDHLSLSARANSSGGGVIINVPTEFPGPNGETWANWDEVSNLPRTFFVNVGIEPTN